MPRRKTQGPRARHRAQQRVRQRRGTAHVPHAWPCTLKPFTRPAPIPAAMHSYAALYAPGAEIDLKTLADAKMLKRMRILEEQVG